MLAGVSSSPTFSVLAYPHSPLNELPQQRIAPASLRAHVLA
jgi:hypothetical protein